MNKESIDKILYEINQLMRDKEFINAKIEYLLVDENNVENYIALISDKEGEIHEVKLKDKEIYHAYDWSYNVDDDVFKYLEETYEIGFMTIEFHQRLWAEIEDIGIEEFTHNAGIQKYLQYCADNEITKQYIDENMKQHNNNIDTPDIMQYFEGLALNETMEYKGYIIEVDEKNFDNSKENLVHIYESKQNYINGEEIETVSLNTIGLKQNIKEYIDETYEMEKQQESEKSYIAFVLGYDLLNEKLSNSENNECDKVYDFCNYLAEKFIQTDYYKNTRHSTYDMLKSWLEDNEEIIQSEYLYYSDKTNKCIIEIGKRHDDKVALVEHTFKDGRKEYIVALYYEVNDKELKWGYGYYYDNNYKKAKEDFEKVKAGGNLVNTFEEKKSKKHKERER